MTTFASIFQYFHFLILFCGLPATTKDTPVAHIVLQPENAKQHHETNYTDSKKREFSRPDPRLRRQTRFKREEDFLFRPAKSQPFWPKGVVRYIVSLENPWTDCDKGMLWQAMDQIMKHTCIKFVRNTDSSAHYVLFKRRPEEDKNTTCSTRLGYDVNYKPDEPQEFLLGNDCLKRMGYMLHEIFHLLGYSDSEKRFSKIEYLYEDWPNILRTYPKTQFATTDDSPDTFQTDLAYDFGSVMHQNRYLAKCRLRQGGPTSICVGQRIHATKCDYEVLRWMYNCHNEKKFDCMERFHHVGGFKYGGEINHLRNGSCDYLY